MAPDVSSDLMVAPGVSATGLVLQTLPLDRDLSIRPLYWLATAGSMATPFVQSSEVVLPKGAVLSSDTYFGNFFKHHWRLYTKLATLTLRLGLRKAAIVRIRSRTQYGETLLVERRVAGSTSVDVPMHARHFRQAGRLWFEIELLPIGWTVSGIN